jgi:hypothetical protein
MYSFPVYISNTLRRLSMVAKIWADREFLLPAPTLCIAADGLARVNQQRTVPAQYRCIVNFLIKYVAQERCSVGCLVVVIISSGALGCSAWPKPQRGAHCAASTSLLGEKGLNAMLIQRTEELSPNS